MAAATAQTVDRYCSLLGRSRLMSQDEVKDSLRRWQETSKGTGDDDAETFRRFLVSRNKLTEYQSHLLMRGHADGYFIDQYKILDLIGKGRMAGVYKAIHASGQVVAIKVLPPSKAKDANLLSRFQREGKMLTKLDHDNVVRAFQLGESGGRHYIVMEYLEGEPLDETLERRKRLPVGEAVRVIHQALLGLQHVFEKGMVHRDLKPANLMLVPGPTPGPGETTLESTVKVLDIGLGRATFDEATKEADPDTQLTQDGTILGTPEYLAPEQARSAHEADIRADIYSLGCILYHMLAGQLPFPRTPGEGVLQMVVRHVTETPKPIAVYLPQAPEGLQKVLDWMMAKDPNQRYPTPARAAQALQMFLAPGVEAKPAPRPLPGQVDYLLDGMKQAPANQPLPAAVQPTADVAPIPIPGIATGRLEADPRRKVRTPGTGKGPAAPSPIVETEEYDVEVVAAAPPPPEPKKKQSPGQQRGLLELDKRDWIMAGFGAGVVIIAILIGFLLSRMLRGTPPSTSSQSEQKEEQPPKYSPPAKKDGTSSRDPKTDDKKVVTPVDDKKTDDKKTEDMKDDKKTDDKKSEEKKIEEKKTDDKKSDEMKDDKKTDPKKTDDKKTDPKTPDSKTDDKKTDPKKTDDKKPEETKKEATE